MGSGNAVSVRELRIFKGARFGKCSSGSRELASGLRPQRLSLRSPAAVCANQGQVAFATRPLNLSLAYRPFGSAEVLNN